MRIIDRIVDVPVVMERQEPTIQPVQKTVEVPQVQFLDYCHLRHTEAGGQPTKRQRDVAEKDQWPN